MTASSGVQSQIGARWKEDFTNTMNSGFAAGTPRTERRKGVREGRETGVAGMPVVKGVGRTGKAPATVPKAMAEAARKQAVRRQVVDMEVYEGIGTGPPAVKKKRKDKGKMALVVRVEQGGDISKTKPNARQVESRRPDCCGAHFSKELDFEYCLAPLKLFSTLWLSINWSDLRR